MLPYGTTISNDYANLFFAGWITSRFRFIHKKIYGRIMSLTRLRTFVEVYRQRSISAAARSLNLTQPAVSQHIAGLESTIGRSLFDRHLKGVIPTAAGDELASEIGDKLDAAEAALGEARARTNEVAGALLLAGHADFLSEVVAVALVPLMEIGIRVRLQAGSGDAITRLLLDGRCDLGVSAFPIYDRRLKSELIREERVIAVASPSVAIRINALSDNDINRTLLSEPMLAYSLERPLVDDWLLKNSTEFRQIVPAMVSQDLRALRNVLIMGFGWTVLPEYLCRKQIQNGELAEITAPVGVNKVGYHLVWLPAGLRQPRVAHARQALLWRLKSGNTTQI